MRVVLAGLLTCSMAGCSPAQPAAAARPPTPGPQRGVDAGNWAKNVGLLEPAPSAAAQAPARELHTAVMSDETENSDQLVPIGRLVYRVSFYVPGSFRDRRVAVKGPAGELQIDASSQRLRARFVGPGWPVPEGSEIRLRPDLPGVYLFDDRGGRSLSEGQLAAWFEGRENKKAESLVAVLHDYGSPAQKPIPVQLLCALFAEWSHQPREALAYRCADGTMPAGFRVGPWSGELTAVVPMEVQRRTLRADEVDPPALAKAQGGRVLLEPAALARMAASRAQTGDPGAALLVDNATNTRAIVIAQGVPVAWIDAGQSLRIEGFNPGLYFIGAIRPLGILRMEPRLIRIPGQLTIGRAQMEQPAQKPAEPKALPKRESPDAGRTARTESP